MSQFGSSSTQQIVGAAKPQLKLKLPVKVLGRFLLQPEDDFGLETAQQLLQRCFKDKSSIKTKLKVFNIGIQLGKIGLLASMPVEFIKYQRIISFVSLNEDRRCLAICIKNTNQRTVTVLQLKDATAVQSASKLIEEGRQAHSDADAAIMSNLSLNTRGSENWELANTKKQTSTQQTQQQMQATVMPGSLFENRPFMREITKPPEMAKSMQIDHDEYQDRYSGVIFDSDQVLQQQQQEQQQVYQQQQQQHQSYIQTHVIDDDEDFDIDKTKNDEIDDMEAWAVFESVDGPPTLLNEFGVYIKESRRMRQELLGKSQKSSEEEVKQFTFSEVEYRRNQSQCQQQRPFTASVHVSGQWRQNGSVDGQVGSPTLAYGQSANSSANHSPTGRYHKHQQPLQLQQQPQLVQLVPVGRFRSRHNSAQRHSDNIYTYGVQ